MLERGPDAPTLCEGWTVQDLAAHLVLRERRPDAAPGIVLAPLRGYTERVQHRLRDGRPWADLVETFRSGPPAVLRPLDEPVNAMELFVHHEDVRRAAATFEPRSLDPAQERVLWQRLRGFARLAGRRVPCGLSAEAPGFGRVRVRSGEPHATLAGPPSELLLYLSGRQRAARVEASGAEAALSALHAARLGI